VDRIAVKASNVDLWRKVREKINNDRGNHCCPEINWAEDRIYYPDCGNWDYIHDAERKHCKIISAQEYLNEGGKDVSEFKGRVVPIIIKPNSLRACRVPGSNDLDDAGIVDCDDMDCDDCVFFKDTDIAKEYIRTRGRYTPLNKCFNKENNMNKNISDVFEKTKEALLVEKHLGNQIGTNFIDGLILADKKTEVLAEAKRLEKEEVAK